MDDMQLTGIENIDKHLLPIDDEIKKYVDEKVMINSRYIFIKKNKENGYYEGYCTHCKEHFKMDTLKKHNSMVKCPTCESMCLAMHTRYGHKNINDSGCFMYYSKSPADPEALMDI